MYDSTSLIHLRTSSLASLVISGFGALLVGCTIVVGDVGHDARDDQDAWEQCYEQYDDCLDAADGDKDAVLACGDQLDACTHEPDGDATATAGASAGADGGADTAADGGADGGNDGAPSSEICVSLHQTCIASAVDIADTLACEALFDHCAHPGECPDCSNGCPEAQLEQCLDDYAGCVAGATKDYEVEACNVVFDGCVAELGADACLPADDAHTDECLAEHALCTACAETDAELAACKDIFDVCVAPAPM